MTFWKGKWQIIDGSPCYPRQFFSASAELRGNSAKSGASELSNASLGKIIGCGWKRPCSGEALSVTDDLVCNEMYFMKISSL